MENLARTLQVVNTFLPQIFKSKNLFNGNDMEVSKKLVSRIS